MPSLLLRPRACAGRTVFFSRRLFGRGRLTLVVLLSGLGATSVSGADRFWITNAGGTFSTAANWSTTSGGAGGATPPAAADVANFMRNSNYSVSFTANVTNSGLIVNNDSVTFDVNGNTYVITGATGTSIGTGVAQTGRLTIKNGTLGVDTAGDRLSVGTNLTSSGFLTVSTGGRLGNGTVDPDMFVGESGTGTFTLEANGRADVGFLNLGQNSGATGTLNVNGPNAVLDVSTSLTVGFGGTGTVNLQNAGVISTASYVKLGSTLASSGTVTVSGLSSKWNQDGVLTVGDAGNASFTVQTAGRVDTADHVLIGYQGTGVGTAIVTGADSIWNMSNTMHIGYSGLGNFAVSAAGKASTLGTVSIATAAGSRGNVVVTGAGSRWSTGAVSVGNAGSSNLTISAAAIVNSAGNVTLGNLATGEAKVAVTGAGSAWNINGSISIANAGTGTLTVDTDANLTATGALTIGDPAGTQVGTLNFSGGTISTGGFTRVGGAAFNWTDGTLLVTGGAFNNSGASLTINGADLDDLPALRLGGGATSTTASTPNLTIGSNHQGALIVSGGSSIQTITTSIASQDGGQGSLHVEGLNSSFSTTGDLGVGGTTSTAGGLGAITLGPGGVASAGGTLRLWSGGTINLQGGTIRFNNLAANGGSTVFASGTVQVTSNFNANATALDALLGATHSLGVGRKIDTLTNTLNLQSNLTVSGGAIAGNILAASADVVSRFDTGATATFVNGISNPAGARMYVTDATVNAGTTYTNGGELHLSGSTATVNGTGFTNSGLVEGAGRINSVVANNALGQIRVTAGQRLEVLGSAGNTINNGLVDVNGGTIEFGRPVTNSSASPSSGLIAARDATLRFQAGLSNSGALTFSSGVSDVFGDVTNLNNLSTPGRIIVTGGAQANFFDDVANGGSIQVSSAGSLQSTAVFLGGLSGNGVSGSGHVFIEGDARPGFSPGTMAFGGDVSFGPLSSLNIELAGTTPGTQYDRVTAANTVSIGGELNVSLLGNFKPTIGDNFQIVAATSGVSGTFAETNLPELAGGAVWNLSYGAGAISLEVGGVLGDFNHDGRVDAADYSVWRDKLGTNSLAADASGNGSVDQDDYSIWKANFGAVAATAGGGAVQSASTSAVPEPSAATLAVAVILGGALTMKRRLK